jgi:glycosyltransferase involved in cell wall biosynthesis
VIDGPANDSVTRSVATTVAAADEIEDDSGQAIDAVQEVTIVAHDVGGIGGMERVLAELVLGLRAEGHDVTVIARSCHLPPGAGVSFHRVRGPSRPLLLAHPWFALAGSLAVAKRRRGVVQSTGSIVFNRVDVVAVHYCHFVGPANPSRPTALFRLNSMIVSRFLRFAERVCFYINRDATFVCVSEGVADEVRRHHLGLQDNVVAIQNGVDTALFAPGLRALDAQALRSELEIAQDRMVSLFVGGEWGRKGLESAIRALAGAAEWDLVVAGSGDTARYRALADSLGVGDSVHWLGVWGDVAVLYELADALVFPSSYEAFPLVALEAAASGLPILATPVNGVRELVRDGESGHLITQAPETIAERLRELAADPPGRARMSDATRRSALEFTWRKTVTRHRRLYARLMARRLAGDAR